MSENHAPFFREMRADVEARRSARAPNTNLEAASRLPWIDDARGLGILLVVFGHTLRGLFAAGLLPEAGLWGEVDAFIYAFHMPLFFFVAGLFLLPDADQPYLSFAKRRLVRLGYPYLIWASLQTFLQCLLARYTNHALGFGDLWKIGLQPPMQFWFLYALLLQVLWIGLLAKLGCGRDAMLLLTAVLFVSAPFVPLGDFMPLNQAREYLPYTSLGVFCGTGLRLHSLERRPSWALLTLVCLGYAAVAAGVRLDLHTLRAPAVVLALLGSLASLALASLVERHGSLASRLLAQWGKASMAIFVAHTLASAATRMALARYFHVQHAAPHLILGTLFGLGVPWVMYSLGKRYRFPYAFEWPVSRPAPAAPALPVMRA